jgi:AMP nucleosidase
MTGVFIRPDSVLYDSDHARKSALLLVSDGPMIPEGVKTSRSDKAVTEKYVR